ncbi:MAG: 4-(cytidine 5'-diphospho)-2-C-methyl-D-erythritol kinase [Candidatus Electrothrix sp. YB6]
MTSVSDTRKTKTTLSLKAPAKINLSLRILGRREDGYHELETLMQKIALHDELQLTLTAEPGVRLRCPGADLPENEDNIIVRAAQLFLTRTGNSKQGIHITLKKNIPVAAGLGGGSSDAAAVLKGLNQLLKPSSSSCSVEELADMGLELGADVPLFVYDFPAARATGIGERLEPAAPLCGYQVLLVNPGIAVSTRWAYTAFSSAAFSSAGEKIALTGQGKAFTLSCSADGRNNPSSDGSPEQHSFHPDDLYNDLEPVTAERYPVIRALKERLLAAGAAGAMMSGSGSTVFGLFQDTDEEQAEKCCRQCSREYEQVYLVLPLDAPEGGCVPAHQDK